MEPIVWAEKKGLWCTRCLRSYTGDKYDLSFCCDKCGQCGFCPECAESENHECHPIEDL